MRIEVLSSEGAVVNTVEADTLEVVQAIYGADQCRIAADQHAQPADPCEWLIDIGPFFDRFGPAKMAVLTSADAGVKAILTDVQIRKWIDLRLPEVATSLAYIGTKVAAVTGTLQTAILTTPVAGTENLALRKLFF
jgi:hypothetical protein